ncbi:heterokaryon incompatibility [Fusarium albosuccineum]|uniref:Heterokaryon incompatibility n=1 Tax=Fusarium albosuccineum TaxID=1237068 RepID=A0A8H4PFF6_9HYPO|nr:heterokaryon incompatibility [Fusarium albosuccineum]
MEETQHFDYRHHQLPSSATHIRLLKLHPSRSATTPESPDSQFHSPLACSLTVTPVSNAGAYKAVSYTWGTAERTSSLDISGVSFPITRALDTALRHLRSGQEPMTLWVDQICIDQSNHAEKADQVLLMSHVYMKAEQVLVWLGPSAGRSDELMDLWQRAGQQALNLGIDKLFTKDNFSALQDIMNDPASDHPLAKRYHELVDSARPDFEDLLQAMIDWNDRFWFRRVWTVQEFCLCPNTVFVCGYKMVQVELVRLACNIFTSAMKKSIRSRPVEDKGFQELVYKAQCHRTGPLLSTRKRRQDFNKGLGPGDELFYLLRKLFVQSDTMVTRNRDRIYGILGLAVDAEKLAIRPDYMSEDPGPIFTSVARKMIEHGRVEILSFSQFPKEDDLNHLPSWVPDWRPLLEPSYYTIFEGAEDHLLAASASTNVSLEPNQDPDVLSIRGYLVDTIEEVGDTWHASDTHVLRHKLLNTVVDFCSRSAIKNEPIYDNPGRRVEAVWRVPVGDLYWTQDTDHTRANRARTDNEYHDCIFILDLLAVWESLSPEERKTRFSEFDSRRFPSGSYQNNMNIMNGKKPYLTRKGYVGMCPEPAAEGDVVVVLKGGRLPYILRPGGDGNFAFVGEAYCDGVMDGEILQRSQEEVFCIR